MHGKNSEENKAKQVEYYNEYVVKQKSVGVNLRHKSIADKLLQTGLKKNSQVLEIGCGIGTFSGLLGGIISEGKALCLDISDKSIELAKEIYRTKKNLIFKTENAVHFDFGDQKFDAIVLPDVIEHIPLEQHAALFEKLSKVLKKDGFIFIHIPNPYYIAWCHENAPETLQIIDQPIYTDELIKNTYPFGLLIDKIETYAIWRKDGDYQYIVLKKEKFQDFSRIIEEKVTFLDKVKYKMNAKRK